MDEYPNNAFLAQMPLASMVAWDGYPKYMHF
jgi:hypothetical protein